MIQQTHMCHCGLPVAMVTRLSADAVTQLAVLLSFLPLNDVGALVLGLVFRERLFNRWSTMSVRHTNTKRVRG